MPIQSIPIELGGKTRNLRLDFNALVLLEDELGIPIADIGKLMSGAVHLKTLRAIMWAALVHEDKTLTVKGVGAMIDPGADMARVADAIRRAFEAAFATAEKNEKKATGPGRNGVGKNT